MRAMPRPAGRLGQEFAVADQAEGLRALVERLPHGARRGGRAHVITMISPSGGLAGPAMAASLSLALSCEGRRVLVLDQGGGAVAGELGANRRNALDLDDVLAGRAEAGPVIIEAGGVRVIPAQRALGALSQAGARGWLRIEQVLNGTDRTADVVLVNASCDGHGLAAAAAIELSGAGEPLLAFRPVAAPLTAAYALIKSAARDHGLRRFRLMLIHRPADESPSAIFRRMQETARRFLGAELELGGVLADSTDGNCAEDEWRSLARRLGTPGGRGIAARPCRPAPGVMPFNATPIH